MRFADLLLILRGATSGEQIIKTAAASSGAITLPAGTTDFSATGGTSQVVKQTTAGGAFTVGQLAAADISGVGTGTVTSVAAGTGITVSPSPIVGAGTVSLATPVSVANGGTGLSAGTSGGVPYYSATGTIASSALLTANALIKGAGAGAAPVASTATVDGSGNLTATGGIAATANSTPLLATSSGYTMLYAPDGSGTTAVIQNGNASNPNIFLRNTTTYIQNRTFTITYATFAAGGVSLLGTNTNDSAAAGNIGEYVVSNVTTPLSITNNTVANLTTISLTAGDWDVSGAVNWAGATMTSTSAFISTTTLNTNQANFATCSFSQHTFASTGGAQTENVSPIRMSLASTTTIYLSIYQLFSAGSGTAIGILRARRMR